MSKKTILIILIVSVLLISGCARVINNSSATQATTQTTTQAVTEEIDDDMNIDSANDMEIYVIRIRDEFYEITNENGNTMVWQIFNTNTGVYPRIEEGQIAKIVADVEIYNGGEDGYSNDKFINRLKSFEQVSYSDILDIFDIADACDNMLDSNHNILKYQDLDNIYLLLPYGGDYVAYRDGTFVGQYSMGQYEDYPEGFFNHIKSEDVDEEKTVPVDGYYQLSKTAALSKMETESDYIIVDVRSSKEYNDGHTIDAINIEYDVIKVVQDVPEPVYELPDKTQLIFVYCDDARRSRAASLKLASIGYTNIYQYFGRLNWDRPE